MLHTVTSFVATASLIKLLSSTYRNNISGVVSTWGILRIYWTSHKNILIIYMDLHGSLELWPPPTWIKKNVETLLIIVDLLDQRTAEILGQWSENGGDTRWVDPKRIFQETLKRLILGYPASTQHPWLLPQRVLSQHNVKCRAETAQLERQKHKQFRRSWSNFWRI